MRSGPARSSIYLLPLLLIACQEGVRESAAPVESLPADSAGESFLRGVEAELRAILPSGQGSFDSFAPSVGFQARYSARGVKVQAQGNGLELASVSWGREGMMNAVEQVEPGFGACVSESETDSQGECIRRLEYDRQELTEWWVGRSDSIEQGWTLDSRPQGQGELRFLVQVSGADLDFQEGSDHVSLLDDSGREWRYGGAIAWDSLGNPLPAQVGAEGANLVVTVNDQGALYPITIDPVLTTASATLNGESGTSQFGLSLSDAGDINADGFDDVIVGAPYYNTDQGRVYVFHGSESGLSTTAALTLTGDTGSLFGYSVSTAGDVNADGYTDVIIGAYGYSSSLGRAYVFHGGASGLDSSPTTTLEGEAGTSQFGRAVGGGGDVNGDGYDDILVGAPSYVNGSYSNAGKVYAFHGSASGVSTSSSFTYTAGVANLRIGTSVANVGHTSNDTYDDAVFGAAAAALVTPRTYYFMGTATGLGSSPTRTWSSSAGYYHGYSTSSAGDVNGDGYDDILVGAYGYSSNKGRFYYYQSAADGTGAPAGNSGYISGANAGDYLSFAVSDAGDLDQDGYDDIILGAKGYGSSAGRVYIYAGSSSGLVTSAPVSTIDGSGSEQLGYYVSSAGDVNGDSYPDILVGAPGASSSQGGAYLYEGRSNTDADADGWYLPQDCDDTNNAIYPGAAESCNEIDDDCDGEIDEGAGSSFYADLDEDTYGDPTDSVSACTAPAGYVADNTDCDDTDPDLNPGETELCDGIDNDCDLDIDEGALLTWYGDLDEDTYGDPTDTVDACTAPAGYIADNSDCDDTDPAVNPAATEVCDGVDNDCDLGVDEGLLTTYYGDLDEDTYGDPTEIVEACTQPELYVLDNTDCDDTNAAINPAATETCDGVDNDCDAGIDEGLLTTYYGDLDEDTYGDPTETVEACSQPASYVLDNTDCDDTNAAVNPAAAEVCDSVDNDCDLSVDEGVTTTFYGDLDEDTYGDPTETIEACTAPALYVADNSDCDDTNAAINPGAAEICNDLDDDCDLSVDEGVKTTFYGDLDEDTYGDPAETIEACALPTGYVADSTDCDDLDATIHPGATEIVADGIDQDCFAGDECYVDSDSDTYGSTSTATSADLDCEDTNESSSADDCDDLSASVNPGATELFNGIDDNCDTDIDEGFFAGWGNVQWPTTIETEAGVETGEIYGQVWADGITSLSGQGTELAQLGYGPLDSDPAVDAGWSWVDGTFNTDVGNNDEFFATLTPAENGVYAYAWRYSINDGIDWLYADTSGSTVADPYDPGFQGVMTVDYADFDDDGYSADVDCDDENPDVNPGATEICNEIDDDCDTEIDELLTSTFYADLDTDTYGDPASSVEACSAPEGYVADNTDCDDTSAGINPGATEICNDLDDDCDLSVDEDAGTTWYYDLDSDGYGVSGSSTVACDQPEGYAALDGDCGVENPNIYPGATEICNELDDDCDELADEGVTSTFYADADTDTYGDATSSVEACEAPAGYVTDNTDCDDAAAGVNPGATETCNEIDDDCDTVVDEGLTSTFYADTDSDTYGDPTASVEACEAPAGHVADNTDCNDSSADINPGATEICNEIDDDCDTAVDEGLTSTFYADVDTDTYGDAASSVEACEAPAGHVTDNTDCNDTNADINPGASESCNEIDDDCDTAVDEGLPTEMYYLDADTDTYGTADTSVESCAAPAGYVAGAGDCNDTNADINPGALEICNEIDDDCDTEIDEGLTSMFYADADTDTYGNALDSVESCDAPAGYVTDSTDCDDTNAAINPGASELPNHLDDDCDAELDENLMVDWGNIQWPTEIEVEVDTESDPIYGQVWVDGYTQLVGEGPEFAELGYGPLDSDPELDEGWTWVEGSFNDDADNNDEFVAALTVSEAGTYAYAWRYSLDMGVTWLYADITGSTAADPYNPEDQGILTVFGSDADEDGFTADVDCDDTNPDIFPGATELCNDIDDDCDLEIDEGVTTTFYNDLDLDTYGDALDTVEACAAPEGYVADGTDCDDTSADINPGAAESCNELDDNCDTQIDEGVTTTFYNDLDLDTYGNPLDTAQACAAPEGYVTDATDCDDTNAVINPLGVETCNGLDDNCDTQIDEGLATSTWYLDADSDGHGLASSSVSECAAPAGYVESNDDCNDDSAAAYPGATEICDDIDNDCDARIDEYGAVGAPTWYRDMDSDGYGNTTRPYEYCTMPAGYAAVGGDCADGNAARYPGATETCDGLDEDCNGIIDDGLGSTWYQDSDGDAYGNPHVSMLACVRPWGYQADNTDCDDTRSATHPGASETCNGIDDDCDGRSDEIPLVGAPVWFRDMDSDGYGNTTRPYSYCTMPAGYAAVGGDCADGNAARNPAATEICNGLDDDCDKRTDETGAVGSLTWYRDADSDGWGNTSRTYLFCTKPAGYVADPGDCADGNPARNPGASELCNSLDDDCDSTVDESPIDGTNWYPDADTDGYGDESSPTMACSAPSGLIADGSDCDDTDELSYPGAEEICDDVDNNCDDSVDEDGACCTDQIHGDRLYSFCDYDYTWAEAQGTCLDIGMEFVAVGSSDEFSWLDLTAVSEFGLLEENYFWVGLSDQDLEGTWEWDNAESLLYTAWAASEPNGGASENCVGQNGAWYDLGCEATWPFVCESVIPE